MAAGHRRHEALQALLGRQEAGLAQAAELERLCAGLARAQNELQRVISERDQKTVQLQDFGAIKADAERRLDTVQQALIDATSEAATSRWQVEMLENLLVTAGRRAEQAERDKEAWVDR